MDQINEETHANGLDPATKEAIEELDSIKNMKREQSQEEVITISEILAGDQPFASWGYSLLKVTREGKPLTMKVPIKSIGIPELMESLARKAPRPPRRAEMIHPDTALGKELRLKRPVVVDREDRFDEAFLKDSAEWERTNLYSLVLNALAVDVKDANGNLLVKANGKHSKTELTGDAEAAIQVLMDAGFTQAHLVQIAKDVRELSEREQVA